VGKTLLYSNQTCLFKPLPSYISSWPTAARRPLQSLQLIGVIVPPAPSSSLTREEDSIGGLMPRKIYCTNGMARLGYKLLLGVQHSRRAKAMLEYVLNIYTSLIIFGFWVLFSSNRLELESDLEPNFLLSTEKYCCCNHDNIATSSQEWVVPCARPWKI
jgi:hypothetical protein